MSNPEVKHPRILRKREVAERIGTTYKGLDRYMLRDDFIKPIPLGNRLVGFLESDLDAWIIEQTKKTYHPPRRAGAGRPKGAKNGTKNGKVVEAAGDSNEAI